MVEEASSGEGTTLRQAIGSHISLAYHDQLSAIARFRKFSCGEYLFREGQSRNELYIVLEGKVDLLMTVPGRGSQRILTVGTGELLAWSAVVGSGTMTCDAIAATNCSLVYFDAKELRGLFKAEPELGFQFMQWLATGITTRLTATRLQMLDLFAREAKR